MGSKKSPEAKSSKSSFDNKFCLAIQYEKLEKIKQLADSTEAKHLWEAKSHDEEEASGYPRTPLHWAAKKGRTDVVEYLIKEKNAPVNALSKEDGTPLELAVRNGHYPVVQLLFQNGANVVFHHQEKYASTALHLAVLEGSLEACKSLIAAGINAAACDQNHRTALHLAAKKNRLEIAAYLLEQDHDAVFSYDKNGCIPLHLAAQYGHYDLVALLIGHKSNILARNHYGYDALDLASQEDDKTIAQLLINEGASITASGSHGTALHLAAENGHVRMIQFLLESKANVNAKDSHGQTPLQRAVQEEYYETAQLLIENKANVDICNNKGDNALDLARKNEFQTLITLLEQPSGNNSSADLSALRSSIVAVSEGELSSGMHSPPLARRIEQNEGNIVIAPTNDQPLA